MTIHRLCRFCFMEKRGARICLEGRSQTIHKRYSSSSSVRKRRQTTYIASSNAAYSQTESKSAPTKSPTKYAPTRNPSPKGTSQQSSRWILVWAETLLTSPNHDRTIYQSTMPGSSRHVWIHEWERRRWGSCGSHVGWRWWRWRLGRHVKRPKVQGTTRNGKFSNQRRSTSAEKKHTNNSKNEINPTKQVTCASVAMTEPNLAQPSSIGPKNNEMKNKAKSTPAFHTIGPIAITPILISGLGCWFPSGSGKDLTNMYATTKIVAMQSGQTTSDQMTVFQDARGTSPDSFSDGWPSFFFLYPVIIVLESLQ